ncbi:MAG TPA: hypothetical protein VL122_01075 [Nitrospirota bacterium]|nr:hypothetical protein [Nitrospirota bacterium]
MAAFFLTMFYASVSLAAVNDLGLHSDAIAQTTQPTNESSVKTSAGIDSEYSPQYFTSFGSAITTPEDKDKPFSSMKEYLEDTAAITLAKGGDDIIWSLAPSLARMSLNPIDDIKNIQLLLKYRF